MGNDDNTMNQKTKVRRIGGSIGFIIPKSIADEMAIKEGDELYVTSSPDGIIFTPYDPDFATAMDDAREFMRSHRNAFRELAK
jgi:putative addiction module antidote